VTLSPKETRDLELKLILTSGGWRISDLVGTDHKSLLTEL